MLLYVTEANPSQVHSYSNLFQSSFWANFKEKRGYETQAFDIRYKEREASMVVVHRPCSAESTFAYVPHGPDIQVPQDRQGPFLESVSERIRPRLPEDCSFIRYDLPWSSPYADTHDKESEWPGPPEPRIRELRMNFGSKYWNLCKAPTDMQAPDTVVLDLERPSFRIFREMHKKARYGVRSPLRRGVRVERRGLDALPMWHSLYLEMAERKGIAAEALGHFRDLFAATHGDEPDVELYLAFQDGRLVAGTIVAFHVSTAYYLYSASSPEGRKLSASYAVLWKAIMRAKARGCRWFDLFGIPPNSDPAHPMHGLYQFKTRFGGRILHLRGCWDYPLGDDGYSHLALASGTENPYYL
jgi:lipid II:glycine glycyltransferase (peptidoglycan interpeptide bridge formation enzyme)